MGWIFSVAKDILQGLLLFWCPCGRISRRSYVRFYVFVWMAGIILAIWSAVTKNDYLESFLLLLIIWLCVAFFMAAVRRGHDLGYSGWYTLGHFWRFSEYLRLLGQTEGNPSPNDYGPPMTD